MGAIIPLIGTTYTFIVYSISFFIITGLFMRNHRTLAKPMLICMVDWMLSSLCAVPFMSYIITGWRGEGSLYNMTVMFYVGVLYFSTVSPVSISVFCLTVDRILVLLMPIHYKQNYRYLLCAANIFVQIVLFLLTFGLEMTEMAPPGTVKACMAVGCITPRSGVYISQLKLAVGILNTSGALAFAIIFARFSRNRLQATKDANRKAQRQANFLAGIAVLMEFTFNCAPNIVGLTFQAFYGALPSGDIGPYLSYFLGTETICISIMYSKVLGNPFKKALTSSSRPKITVTRASGQRTAITPSSTN